MWLIEEGFFFDEDSDLANSEAIIGLEGIKTSINAEWKTDQLNPLDVLLVELVDFNIVV